ncbi:MAG: penicillin-binding protein 2 [Micrococcales bacterium]|nr:penicillin-binding protein 2 [Micrococcales bacterium]
MKRLPQTVRVKARAAGQAAASLTQEGAKRLPSGSRDAGRVVKERAAKERAGRTRREGRDDTGGSAGSGRGCSGPASADRAPSGRAQSDARVRSPGSGGAVRRNRPRPGSGSAGSRPAADAGGGSRGGSSRALALANPRRRVRAAFLAVLFVFTLFTAQLVRLQGFDASQVAAKARAMRTGAPDIIPAQRGKLLDRDGVVLAGSIERRDVVADQLNVAEFEVRDPATKKTATVGAAGAAKELAPLLGMDEATLRAKLTGESRYVQLARKLEPDQWRRIEALGIPGIASEENPSRTYPAGAPLAPVLGWVGADGKAKDGSGGGLELLYDEQLSGTPGSSQLERSADSRVIPMGYSSVTPARAGKDLQLSLDNDLSWYAYNAIADQVKKSDADSGTAVVMDVKGRLRAVSQFPSFDPIKRSAKGSEFGSLPFQDVFEPGSTAKVMSLGAALDTGAVTPTTSFRVPNRLKRSDKTFRDSHEHKTLYLTTAGILAQSSNIGTLLAGERVPPATLEQYFRAFGLGQRSGVGFPGESSGLMAPSTQWSGSQRYTVMFGQGMSMTAIQDAGVFQTIANGGVRIPPSVVEGVRQADGTLAPAQVAQGTRVLSQKTATELSIMLESVVGSSGTAQQAAIAGIPVAGKTGTAQRYDAKTRGYSGYTASFVGFAPADKPELIVAVILQNPKNGYYGGTTAGPVFQQVMSYALQRYGIPPTGTQRTPFPLQVGQKPAADTPKVDPSVIGPNGPVRAADGLPTPPRLAVPSEAPGIGPDGTSGSTPSPGATDSSGASRPRGDGTSGAGAR